MKRHFLLAIPILLFATYCGLRGILRSEDFEIFYESGRRFLAAEPVYRLSDGVLPLKTSPFFALLMVPFSLLPLLASKVIWYFLSLTSLIFGVFSLCRLLSKVEKNITVTNWVLIILLSSLVSFRFLENNFALGQVNILFAFCSFAPFIFYKKPSFGGFLLGAVAQMKLTPLAFVAYLIWKRESKLILWAIVGIMVAFITPFIPHGFEYGISQYKGWWLITQAHSNAWMVSLSNQSFLSWLSGAFNVSPLSSHGSTRVLMDFPIFPIILGKSFILLLVGAVGITVAKLTYKSGNSLTVLLWEYALIGIFAILFSPLSQKAQFSLILYSSLITLVLSLQRSPLTWWVWQLFAIIVWCTAPGFVGQTKSDLLELWGILPVALFFTFSILWVVRKDVLNPKGPEQVPSFNQVLN